MDLTFKEVWAALMELRESQKETDRLVRESREETDRILRESREETDRKMKETADQIKETDRILRESQKETDRKMKETAQKIGSLGSRIGELIEHLTASNLLEEFKKQNYVFAYSSRNFQVKDTNNRILAEIDILLENNEYAMAVEVKSLLTLSDVSDHIKRLETLRRYRDIAQYGRKYLGSVAGALIEDTARDFALKNGIYVIEHPGETVRILAPERVRAW
jgi:hypothetical protein